jgi:hypothetical protein
MDEYMLFVYSTWDHTMRCNGRAWDKGVLENKINQLDQTCYFAIYKRYDDMVVSRDDNIKFPRYRLDSKIAGKRNNFHYPFRPAEYVIKIHDEWLFDLGK